jgi:5-bromo-4-chloroindolyl phosphate hydrolysis protein
MGDPFSVAGRAVGVISFGLSVCQGLITYYGQYKSFHKDIHEATPHLDNMDCILKALMNTAKQSELQNASLTAEPARIALDTIDRCNQKLKELEDILKKCKDTPVTTNDTSKSSKSRALYPFRRDTLLALRELVSWLQDNLGNSLSLLNL